MLYASLQILPLNIALITDIKLDGMNQAIAVDSHEGIASASVKGASMVFKQKIKAIVAVTNASTAAVDTVNFLPNMARK